jgi:heptosyltransferase-2
MEKVSSSSRFLRLHPRRILVRGVNWLGDAVMTTPALMRLREHFPEAHIAMLTAAKLQDIWWNHPAVNDVITFDPNESVFSVGRRLRAGQFDLALILPNSPRSALEAWLARIPQRVGLARPWRSAFLTNAIIPRPGAVKMRKRSVDEIKALIAHPPERGAESAFQSQLLAEAHQIHEYLHLDGFLGANTTPLPPQLRVTEDEVASVRKKFGLETSAPPIFGLNPGAEYGPAKRWPVERFIAAAREVQKRTGCTWLILGGKGDLNLAEEIYASLKTSSPATHNLAGRTTLRELCAVLKWCDAVLTNDTGPMHLAAAVGTRVVVPFGSTSPELTGPGMPGDARHQLLKSEAPCSPCFLRECPIDFRCMKGIEVDSVVAALLQEREKRH